MNISITLFANCCVGFNIQTLELLERTHPREFGGWKLQKRLLLRYYSVHLTQFSLKSTRPNLAIESSIGLHVRAATFDEFECCLCYIYICRCTSKSGVYSSVIYSCSVRLTAVKMWFIHETGGVKNWSSIPIQASHDNYDACTRHFW